MSSIGLVLVLVGLIVATACEWWPLRVVALLVLFVGIAFMEA